MPAGLAAAAVSGAPSTFYALAKGRPILETTEAAGSILLPGETRTTRLVAAAAVSHVAISMFWTHVLALTLPRRRRLFWGSAAGLAIGFLDLVIIGGRWPRIRELPLAAQLADHVAFGAVVAALLERPSAPTIR